MLPQSVKRTFIFIGSFIFFFLISLTIISPVKAAVPTVSTRILPKVNQDTYYSFGPTTGTAVDSSGNIYILELDNDRVEKFSPDGNLLLRIGGVQGTADGALNNPFDLAIDSLGQVYVADYNCRVSVFSSTTGAFIKKFTDPSLGDCHLVGVAVDSAGNVYTSSYDGQSIIEFNSSGVIVNQFGTWGTGNGQFKYPREISLDSSNNLYIADSVNNRIQVFDSNGNFIRIISDPGLYDPAGVYVDPSQHVWVADTGAHNIYEFTNNGGLIQTFSSWGSADGQLDEPTSLKIDSNGDIFVAQRSNNEIEFFHQDGTFITKWSGMGSEDGQLMNARGMAMLPNGDFYVSDTENNRIEKFDSTGTFLSAIGEFGTGDGQMIHPMGVAVDSSGNIYVADYDSDTSRIDVFDSNGNFLRKWGQWGTGDGEFKQLLSIKIGPDNLIYTAELEGDRVQVFDLDGNFIRKFGSSGSRNGQFDGLSDIAIDSSGNVFATDMFHSRVQKFDSNGHFVTKWGTEGNGDLQFTYPSGIAVDASGNVYVADTNNNKIRVYDNNGKFMWQYGGSPYFSRPQSLVIHGEYVYILERGGDDGLVVRFQGGCQMILPTGDDALDSSNHSVKFGSEYGLRGDNEVSLTDDSGNFVGSVSVDFSADRDWTPATIETTSSEALFHFPGGIADAPGAANTYSLYVPYVTGATRVGVCPGVANLDQVGPTCANLYYASVGNGASLVVLSDSKTYWKIDGVSGTGGFNDMLSAVQFVITPNKANTSESAEVMMNIGTATNYAATDQVQITWEDGVTLENTCATPTTDADGDSTIDGDAVITNGNVYTYTFTQATTLTNMNFCVKASYATAGTYSVILSDTIGDYGTSLFFVGQDNSVNIFANVAPTLSFNIRTLDDSADTNVCDLGTVSTATPIPNYDTVVDGSGECGYSLAIGTNAVNGFMVQITSDGSLRNANASIADVIDTASWTAGIEAYGLTNITAAQTGRNSTTGLYDQPLTREGNFELYSGNATPIPTVLTDMISYTDGVQYSAGGDNTDVTQVLHGLVIGSGTPAGSYSQVITYTLTASF